jgi:hypothetical protein
MLHMLIDCSDDFVTDVSAIDLRLARLVKSKGVCLTAHCSSTAEQVLFAFLAQEEASCFSFPRGAARQKVQSANRRHNRSKIRATIREWNSRFPKRGRWESMQKNRK